MLTLCVYAVTLVSNMTEMVSVRFVTGLAIGSILACATTVASEIAPLKYRAAAVSLAALGYSVGATLVGPVANRILDNQDWRALFTFSAGFTALIFLFTFFVLPESIQYLKSNAHRDERALEKINKVLRKLKSSPVKVLPAQETSGAKPALGPIALTRPEHLMRTIFLWVCFFASLFIT